MKNTVAEELYSMLDDNAELSSIVVGGVHTAWTIEGVKPRVILGFDFSRINDLMRGGSVNIDVFVGEADTELASQIAEKIVSILDRKLLNTNETGNTLRVVLESDQLIPDPDSEIIHWSMRFGLRFYRNRAMSYV